MPVCWEVCWVDWESPGFGYRSGQPCARGPSCAPPTAQALPRSSSCPPPPPPRPPGKARPGGGAGHAQRRAAGRAFVPKMRRCCGPMDPQDVGGVLFLRTAENDWGPACPSTQAPPPKPHAVELAARCRQTSPASEWGRLLKTGPSRPSPPFTLSNDPLSPGLRLQAGGGGYPPTGSNEPYHPNSNVGRFGLGAAAFCSDFPEAWPCGRTKRSLHRPVAALLAPSFTRTPAPPPPVPVPRPWSLTPHVARCRVVPRGPSMGLMPRRRMRVTPASAAPGGSLCSCAAPPTLLHCTPPPPIRRPNLADFSELVCRIVGFLNLADLFCRITRFLGLCRLVLPTCWGFWVLGHLSWRRHLLWDTAPGGQPGRVLVCDPPQPRPPPPGFGTGPPSHRR